MPKVSYPKYLFRKDGSHKYVKTAAEHEALVEKEPDVYAESPEHFDEDGFPIFFPEPPDDDVVIPGVTPGAGKPFPKMIFHPDGRQITVDTQGALDNMLASDDRWREDMEFPAHLAQNAVDAPPDPGESLWDTPIPDVLVMLGGADLKTLRTTLAHELRNAAFPGGRKGLVRELEDLIQQGEEKLAKDKQ